VQSVHATLEKKPLRKNLIVIIVVLFAVVIVCATTAVLFFNGTQPEEEKVRDAAMNFIKTNHPENATTMAYLNDWQCEVQHEEGTVSYRYACEYWSVHVQHPIDSTQTWTIEGVYTHDLDLIWWKGTYQNGIITETSYRMHP